ncbi:MULTISPECIES: retropepsin-like aspartic protease [Rhizobium]|uniref:retropepsin-like aspartic protease n=1 Tax=Rhizobium TaxID=379 RepID=UPI000462B1C9|nr:MULTISPECIES: retropepsin-like aspartic protease [Rhizobium]UFS81515.1 retropepsin-like domain-containing protein [Rhizobium sp. T136]
MYKIITTPWAVPLALVIGGIIGAVAVAFTPLRDTVLGTYVTVRDQALIDAASGLRGQTFGGSYAVSALGKPEPLQGHGMLIPVTIVLGGAGSKEVLAMVDTGAARTFVKKDILKTMGAKPVGTAQVWSGPNNSGSTSSIYEAEVWVLGKPNKVQLLDADLNPEDVLLGRDILANYILTYDGVQGLARLEPPRSSSNP